MTDGGGDAFHGEPDGLQTPGSFSSWYDRWSEADAWLRHSYQDAWSKGDWNDRYAALTFIFQRRVTEGLRLLAEGVASDDWRLARHALGLAALFKREGYDLPTEMDSALHAFSTTFPNSELATLVEWLRGAKDR